MKKIETVAVLGASEKESRYSNKAVRMLLDHGHKVVPIHPRRPEIYGIKSLADLNETAQKYNPVDTLTVYVGKQRSNQLIEPILSLKPERIILNPGAENDHLEKRAKKNGIDVINACTLVMLSTGQF